MMEVFIHPPATAEARESAAQLLDYLQRAMEDAFDRGDCAVTLQKQPLLRREWINGRVEHRDMGVIVTVRIDWLEEKSQDGGLT